MTNTETIINSLVQTLLPIIISALGSVLIAMSAYYANYFKQKAKSEQINRYIDLLDQTVYDVVIALNQTTVDKLKEASADGKLTPEEVQYLKEDAFNTITNILGLTGMNVLNLAFDDVNALIASKIQRTVREAHPVEEAKQGDSTEIHGL